MIDIIVSASSCPHCDAQKRVMEKSFFKDEYRIIEVGSKEFDQLDVKEKVEAVPFIVVRNEDGSVRYADKGKLDGQSLHQIERVGAVIKEQEVVQEKTTFNLRQSRQYQAAGRLSKHMDA